MTLEEQNQPEGSALPGPAAPSVEPPDVYAAAPSDSHHGQSPCWRCGKPVTSDAPCPHCLARPRHQLLAVQPASLDGATLLRRLLLGYAVLMTPIVLYSIHLHATGGPHDHASRTPIVVIETIDTFITLVLLFWIGKPGPMQTQTRRRWAAWLLAFPALVAALALNFGYHHVIRSQFRSDWGSLEATTVDLTTIVTTVIQPAIIEELFFRYLALGVLLRIMGPHSAVFISSVMFALAHVYQPLGLPYLAFMGAVLGYARIWSGGLLLPMLLHALHNAAVVLAEVCK